MSNDRFDDRFDDSEALLRRLIGGEATAEREIRRRADADAPAQLLVMAALISEASGELLERAAAKATTNRDRQLVAIAGAHLDGEHQRFGALVRDHLVDHPDSVLAAWIASRDADRTDPHTPEHDKESS